MDQPQNPNYPDPVTPPPVVNPPAQREAQRSGSAAGEGEPGGEAAPPPPLTPVAWLLNNGIYLLVFGALIGWVIHKFGLDGLWYGALVVFGVGVLIFVHELGHFLTAKWCDVHVQTFSIGFGPALPGCSFQRGETTYKIGVIPLGGYVNMVGEGPEADEDENYPRSFKNKTVGQRMLIISAGVVMNVLLACILFVIVYRYHGVARPPAIVGRVDAGSPVWIKGIRSGTVITHLGKTDHPYFDDLRIDVVLSGEGERIPFTLHTPGGSTRTIDLEPRRDANDLNPIIGLSPPSRLRLLQRPSRETLLKGPFAPGSAAAAARPLTLRPGEVVTASSADPEHPDELKPLEHDRASHTFDTRELAGRLVRLAGRKFVVRVQPDGAGPAEERELPLVGFDWGDLLVGTTRPEEAKAQPYNPYAVSPLPVDPREPAGGFRDPFVYHDRLVRLAGLPLVIQVRRSGAAEDSAPVDLFVPPSYHTTFAMRMEMGTVAAVRDDSPAARAGLQKGDLLIRVKMTDAGGKEVQTWEDLDPERLPFQLAQAAARTPGKKQVAVTVRRVDAPDAPLPAMDWDDSWDSDEETPASTASPVAVPQLGLAFWVMSRVMETRPGGPAAAAGLERGDRITAVRFKEPNATGTEMEWGSGMELESKEDDVKRVYGRWAHVFWLTQLLDDKEVQFKKQLPDDKESDWKDLAGQPDETWPLVSRGLHLQSDLHIEKADSLGQALVMGAQRTGRDIKLMYLQVRSLLTRRVSTKQLGGPLAIISTGFAAASSGWYDFLLIMAVISINLAVVNFLPIPILDGGHMVFLIYEKLRGRPPSETVRVAATYIGLAAIASLMIFVFYQDIRKIWGL